MANLVIAEHNNAELRAMTLHAVTAAGAIGGETAILVAGSDCRAVAEQAAQAAGVNRVLLADDPVYANPLAENLAPLIAQTAGDFSHVIATATTFGKNVMPRAAALMDMAQISEITQVLTEDTFVRPIYAGNGMATVKSADAIKFITVRSTAFEACAPEGGGGEITAVEPTGDKGLSRFVKQEVSRSERPELTSARIVISGGRGMQGGENFAMLEEAADLLGAAVGASRAAVDAGFVPNEYQVGQTGKVVAPDLYVAIGISGAIQHLAGMKDSKVIVAINKHEEAPIFQVADYGLVADLFDAVPALIAELKKLGYPQAGETGD
ncbi:MAG: FAD-binding protein [Alphaproteobacteria bacterium]